MACSEESSKLCILFFLFLHDEEKEQKKKFLFKMYNKNNTEKQLKNLRKDYFENKRA